MEKDFRERVMRTERGNNVKTKDLTAAKRTAKVGENRPFEQDKWK